MSAISFFRHIAHTAAKGGALTGLTVWGWSSPFLIFGLLFTELASLQSFRDISLIVVVGVFSHLALGGVFWLAGSSVLARGQRENAGFRRVLAVVVVGGTVRGFVIVAGFEVFQVGVENPWWARVITSILLITVSFLYTAYSVELWRGYVKRRRELLATIATNEAAVNRQELATAVYRDVVVRGVEEDIQAAKKQTTAVIDTISHRIEEGGISPEELDSLFGESDRAWRDASHRAWEGANPDVPRITTRELTVTLLGSQPVALTVFVFGAIFGLFRVVGADLGLARALPITATVLAGQLVIGWAMNAASRAGAPWNQMSFGAGLLILVVWPVAVGVAWDLDAIVIISLGWLGAVSFFFAVFLGLPVALAQSGEAVLAELEKRVDESAITQLRTQGEMFVLAQKIGAYMHGPLRSQFLQLSMELRLALENADPFEVANVLSKLREVAAGVEQRAETAPDLREFLDNWRALITIDSNLDEVHIPGQIRSKVTTVVTEAVNNAIRHGHAKQVGVFFRYRPEGLLVEVIGAPTDSDDGGEAGLGAHILNDIAPGMWLSDVTEDGRYRLRVTIKSTG